MESNNATNIQKKSKFKGCLCLCIVVLIFAFILSLCSSPSSDVETAEDREKGFHCLSSWNGSHPGLVKRVKTDMNDPSSFKHVETLVSKKRTDGTHTIKMTFRGKNAFGGVVKQTVVAKYSNSSCKLIEGSVSYE